ncbi:GNAT family N-acetyltransferase [Robertkochia solimangrovi]|uniref:GNAT family N-acetyltransferase n=1 Tax=Robertkochia solimangrovi TaxID=2213046 RepID=UPI00117C2123|nr:GNAT family N-acetyltransferase [Robertkochia solimangrovi]TRZ44408.1 N-acetyltransferase [Robertkochia solimangrovi]
MGKIVSLETERLIMRPTSHDDEAFLLELMNSPKFLQYIGDRNLKTIEEVSAYIDSKFRAQYDRLGFSNFTLIRKADGIKIGSCGLYDREGLDGLDLGYALLPNFEGSGFAYEAARALSKVAYQQLGIELLLAITTKDNKASQKLLEKLGFEYAKDINLPEDPTTLMLFEHRKVRKL